MLNRSLWFLPAEKSQVIIWIPHMEVTVSALKKVMGAKEVFKEFGIYIYV